MFFFFFFSASLGLVGLFFRFGQSGGSFEQQRLQLAYFGGSQLLTSK